MKNVLRVFSRDIVRLLKAPAALVVVIALILLPSLYTWVNVIGFWDPYSSTGNLRVCVVNEDNGAYSDTMGQLDLGDQIVTQLESDTQLGWVFTDRDTAMDEVQSGKAYAAFIIPSDFSWDFTTLLSSDFQRPQLEYYVNEKTGAVSPKITDTGATTLEESVNSTFVSVASSVAADQINAKLLESQGQVSGARDSVTLEFEKAKKAIAESRASVQGLKDATSAARDKTAAAQSQLVTARSDIANISDQLQRVSTLTTSAQTDLMAYSLSLMTALDKSSILASQAAAKTNTAIGQAAGSVTAASGDIDAAITSGKAVVAQNKAIIAQLQTLADSLPDGAQKDLVNATIASLQTENSALETEIANAQVTSDDAVAAAKSIASASDAVNTAVQNSISSADDYRTSLSTTTLPAVNTGLSQLAATSSSLSAAVSNQQLLIDQASLVLDQLDSTLDTTTDALSQTDDLLSSLQTSLDTTQTDLAALGTSDALSDLFRNGVIDAKKISDFMRSPTELRTETLYSLNAYGSAMAPLFTNLTLWIGVFMLMVIMKLEVDDEGIEKLTIGQRYWARLLFLAPIAALQAIVCCAGNLIIGVQCASVALYILTAIVASLTYLSIQYALSVTLQHIGKGICVILVFAQIPGATGLYPVEMTPPFFQAVYPFLPFTYGINAMRETIGGFYNGTWAHLMVMLLVFLGVSFVIGLLLRPAFTNLNRMFSKQIRESGILNGEEAQVPVRRYRINQLIEVLSDSEEYRTQVRGHAEQFLHWYPRLKAGAWIFGIAVPTIATTIFSVAGSEKVVVLTAWLVWFIIVLMFLVVIEHIRDNLEHQLALEDMSDDELSSLFSIRSGLEDLASLRDKIARRGSDAV